MFSAFHVQTSLLAIGIPQDLSKCQQESNNLFCPKIKLMIRAQIPPIDRAFAYNGDLETRLSKLYFIEEKTENRQVKWFAHLDEF